MRHLLGEIAHQVRDDGFDRESQLVGRDDGKSGRPGKTDKAAAGKIMMADH